jgi:RNA polymerase sigma factor (sigma-70 family)
MARTVYYIRSHEADGTNEYTQITGTEFYSLVSTEEGKKRCFIRLVEEDSSDAPTIVIETTKDQYNKWRRDYDAERYKIHNKSYTEISYDGIREEIEEPVGGMDPQEYVIGLEIADRIRDVYRELNETDKQIFSKSFVESPKKTISKIADELGMSRMAVSRRVKKIQEKILKKL